MLIVVKIGGDLVEHDLSNLIHDLKRVVEGNQVILVHGGSDIVTEVSNQLGYEPQFVISPSGFKSRYTSSSMTSFQKQKIGLSLHGSRHLPTQAKLRPLSKLLKNIGKQI